MKIINISNNDGNMELLDIVKSIYLLDFYERRTDTIIPATSSHLMKCSTYFGNNRCGLPIFRFREAYKFYQYCFEQTLTERYTLVQDILTLGNGIISLCGLSLLDIMSGQAVNQFNLYLHSCNKLLAQELILKSLTLLNGTIYYGSKHLYIRLESCSVVFDLQIYKNKEEILKTIGPAPERHGWNPIDGYFSTVNGILSLAMKIFPIDDIQNAGDFESYYYKDIIAVTHRNKLNRVIQNDNSRTGLIYDCNSKCVMYSLPIVYRKLETIHTINLTAVKNIIPSLLTLQDNKQQYISKSRNYNKDCIVVGITDDRYVAFAGCRIKFMLPNELFRLLCDYWLKEEALDTAKALTT